MTRNQLILSWILRAGLAVILLQTLFFKFTGAEESVYIFSTLGVEPWGRFAAGIVELAAVALILYPPTTALGAVLTLGVGAGAMTSHSIIGLVVRDDGGLLFTLAIAVFVSSAVILFLHRAEVPLVGHLLRSMAV